MSILFAWIPRTGGSSLSAAFEASELSYQRIIDADKYRNGLDVTTFQHWPIKAVITHLDHVDMTYLEHCWSFSIVRNTWDRLVSLYAKITELGWITYSFEGFIQELTTKEFDTDILLPNGLWFGAEQTIWLDYDLDFIGSFENREETYKKLEEVLGCELQRLHVNAAKRGKYQDYYTLKTRSAVARRYKEEIAIFDYKF